MLLGAGVGGDAAGGNGPAAQRPHEPLVPVGTLLVGAFGVGQGAGHALVGAVDVGVQGFTLLGLQPVLLVPDVLGRRLHGDLGPGCRCLDRLEAHRAHVVSFSLVPEPDFSSCGLAAACPDDGDGGPARSAPSCAAQVAGVCWRDCGKRAHASFLTPFHRFGAPPRGAFSCQAKTPVLGPLSHQTAICSGGTR